MVHLYFLHHFYNSEWIHFLMSNFGADATWRAHPKRVLNWMSPKMDIALKSGL